VDRTAQRVAAAERSVDQLNDVVIVQDLVHRPEFGIPELVPLWQQNFEDATLRVRATDHAASLVVARVRCAGGTSASGGITRITMGNASGHVEKIVHSVGGHDGDPVRNAGRRHHFCTGK
jgi:hypothetical protein